MLFAKISRTCIWPFIHRWTSYQSGEVLAVGRWENQSTVEAAAWQQPPVILNRQVVKVIDKSRRY
jgi:hypothetical protein